MAEKENMRQGEGVQNLTQGSLVQIGSSRLSEEKSDTGISRRNFLKVLGSASALGVASGCADSNAQKIFSNAKGQNEQVPGVAIWYKSTCTECSTGCGITVRTREGRAVKIEGNSASPINRGGLCALGQASLQDLYNPDRVRQPLERMDDMQRAEYAKGKGIGYEAPRFKPITWARAYARIAYALSKKENERVLLTGELNGSEEKIFAAFAKAGNFQTAAYDPIEPVQFAKAHERVFGVLGIPDISLSKAEVVLNFGADFLETWVNPVGLAREWADSRRREKPTRYIHVEARRSLTGANADSWLSIKPGTEAQVALLFVKLLLDSSKAANISEEVRNSLAALVKNVDVDASCKAAGLKKSKLLLAVQHLRDARSSVVLAGGSATGSEHGDALATTAVYLNVLLGNYGNTPENTLNLAKLRKPKSSYKDTAKLVEKMDTGKVGLLVVAGTNPAYSLPGDLGFAYAAKKVGLKVCISSAIDETADACDIILPPSHSLESWGDSHVVTGVHGLIQPTMKPIFDTRSRGDILIHIAEKAGFAGFADEAKSFQEYVQKEWQALHASSGSSEAFSLWWQKRVQEGLYLEAEKASDTGIHAKAAAKTDFAALLETDSGKAKAKKNELVLYPYASVKTFDGRSANRPWLQELPDPMTQVVWDAWGELHPDTAKALGLEQGDHITLRNGSGELNVPAYITKMVHPGVVAVPLGQGHENFGRYATAVQDRGNVYAILPEEKTSSGTSDYLRFAAVPVSVSRGRNDMKMVNVQGSDTQLGRGIARTNFIGGEHDFHEHHVTHGPVKQMFVQREHPMYSWGMAVDLNACTGCSACVVACYAENNIPVVGKEVQYQEREMSWLRIERFIEKSDGLGHALHGHEEGVDEELYVNFIPMMCQHCGNAPCEPVCPVYATYHNDEGLNVMVYNRCVGTRYCSNNCSYKVRRYNWFEYEFPEPLNLQLNPDVTKRSAGVMEKCTFCVQRIVETKDLAKDEGRLVADGEVQPACVQSCPTQALAFGDLNDPESKVAKMGKSKRAYKVFDAVLNTQPAISYLARRRYPENA